MGPRLLARDSIKVALTYTWIAVSHPSISSAANISGRYPSPQTTSPSIHVRADEFAPVLDVDVLHLVGLVEQALGQITPADAHVVGHHGRAMFLQRQRIQLVGVGKKNRNVI